MANYRATPVVHNNVRDLRDRDISNPAISCAENIKAAVATAAAVAARRFYFCRLFAAAKLGTAGKN